MSNEQRFWDGIETQFSAGWNTPPAKLPRAIAPSECSVFVYAVDTLTGWVCGGATQSESFAGVKRDCAALIARGESTATRFLTLAENMIIEGAQTQASSKADVSESVINAVGLALASTDTFDLIANQRTSLDGHWFYMIYHTRDGVHVSHAAFCTGIDGGFMSGQKLLDAIKIIVQFDTSGSDSYLRQRLDDLGGVVLSPKFS